MSQPLRVGVAGLGFGASVHAPALLAQQNVELVGIAGRDATRAQMVANNLGIARGCGSVDELLSLNLDAITLALPPDQTEAAIRKALKAGVHILCEKPLGTDAKVAAELATLAQGRITAMDFIFGELQTFCRLKSLIDSKTYGMVREVKVEWQTQSWAHRNHHWSWKTDKAQGGGVLSLLGSHVFYLAEWLLGPAISVLAEIGEPVAQAFAPPGAEAAEDTVWCRLQHKNNVIFEAKISNAQPGVAVHRWTVIFERSTAVVENIGADYMANFTLTVSEERMNEPKTTGDGRTQPFTRLLQRFLAGAKNHQPVFPDLVTGARVQAFDALVRISAVTGKEVAV